MFKSKPIYQPLLPSSDQLKSRNLRRKFPSIFTIFVFFSLFYLIFHTNFLRSFKGTRFEEHAIKIQAHAAKFQENVKERAVKLKEEAVELHGRFMQFFGPDNAIVLHESGIVLEDGLTEVSKRFISELNLTNPGEDGRKVILDENLLTDEHRDLIQQSYDNFGYNTFISNLISLNRKIPDVRNEICRQKLYKDLPKASIVITFKNEAFSVLIRTVHSILINTREDLLEEIILVDDASDLKENLEDYCKKLKKVKLIRAHAGAKVLGMKNAKGPVIVSLEGHSEVSPGWIEPLLDRMEDNPTLAVYGEAKKINSDNFEFDLGNFATLTAFDWNLNIIRPDIKTYQPELDDNEPHKSPIINGQNFAIWKEFAEKLDYFDSDTNAGIELGLKHWLCGGSVEFVPCSSVFIMQMTSPDSEKDLKSKLYDNDRIIESWFDDNYKKYYYRTVGDTKNRSSKNLEIKEKLKCPQSISWYFKNVYTDVKIPHEISDEVWLTTTTTTSTTTTKTTTQALTNTTEAPTTTLTKTSTKVEASNLTATSPQIPDFNQLAVALKKNETSV